MKVVAFRLSALLGALACSGQPARPAPSAANGPATPQLPGPAREGARLADRAPGLNAECERCHTGIAQEWRGSLHHESFSNSSFQAAFAIEKLAFCQGCHAPEADPRAGELGALGTLGVGCTSCHLTDSGLLAPLRSAAVQAPHPVLRTQSFATAGACASCHEFSFPDAAERHQTALMQSTVSEHARSAEPAESCAGCHMPHTGADSHRSHAFGGSRDPAMLRRAVSVAARRLGSGHVEVVLSPAWLGHAFPTGDLFRRLRVSAELVGPDYQLLASSERFLTRHFERKPRGLGFELMDLKSDDRVGLAGAAPSRVELALDGAGAEQAIHWRVSYQRVAHPRGVDARDAQLDADVEIASGVLAPQIAATAKAPLASQPRETSP